MNGIRENNDVVTEMRSRKLDNRIENFFINDGGLMSEKNGINEGEQTPTSQFTPSSFMPSSQRTSLHLQQQNSQADPITKDTEKRHSNVDGGAGQENNEFCSTPSTPSYPCIPQMPMKPYRPKICAKGDAICIPANYSKFDLPNELQRTEVRAGILLQIWCI